MPRFLPHSREADAAHWLPSRLLPLSVALLLLLAAVSAGAVSVLVIPPDGDAPATTTLAAALVDDLNHTPGIQAGIFDPESPSVKLALSRHSLTTVEVRKPNEFPSALHLAALYGAASVVFGKVTAASDGHLDVQLSYANVVTASVSPLSLPAAPLVSGPEEIARRCAALIAERLTPPPDKEAAVPADSHWEESQRLLREGLVEAAAREISFAILAAPDNGRYRAGYAALLLQRGQVARAVALYNDAVALAPFDASVRLGLGRALEANRDPSGALSAYREAARLDPSDPQIHLALGRLLLRSGSAADGAAELSLVDAGRDPQLIDALADAYAGAGDTARAMTLLNSSISLSGKRAAPRESLAALQLKDSHPELAIQTLLAEVRASIVPTAQARTTAEDAATADLVAAIAAIPTASPDDLKALRTRLQAVSDLLDLFPVSASQAKLRQRHAVAASDALQAVVIRLGGPGSGAPGDVAVLISQARQLLSPPAH